MVKNKVYAGSSIYKDLTTLGEFLSEFNEKIRGLGCQTTLKIPEVTINITFDDLFEVSSGKEVSNELQEIPSFQNYPPKISLALDSVSNRSRAVYKVLREKFRDAPFTTLDALDVFGTSVQNIVSHLARLSLAGLAEKLDYTDEYYSSNTRWRLLLGRPIARPQQIIQYIQPRTYPLFEVLEDYLLTNEDKLFTKDSLDIDREELLKRINAWNKNILGRTEEFSSELFNVLLRSLKYVRYNHSNVFVIDNYGTLKIKKPFLGFLG